MNSSTFEGLGSYITPEFLEALEDLKKNMNLFSRSDWFARINSNRQYMNILIYMIYYSASIGDAYVVRQIIDLDIGVPLNAPIDDETPLFAAIKNKNYEIVELLLKHGACANISGNDRTPLFFAVLKNDLDLVRLLLKYGANPNLFGNKKRKIRCLVAAVARKSDIEIIKLLLFYGENPNEQSPVEKKETALHIAAAQKTLELVHLLLDYGADSKLVDECGNYPSLCKMCLYSLGEIICDGNTYCSRRCQHDDC